MIRQEAYSQYTDAVKMAKRYERKSLFRPQRPQLQTLDVVLDLRRIAAKQELGVVTIPLERVVGTKDAARSHAFAGNFMPMLSPTTEFAGKWISVCEALFRENSELEPIECYEYLGKFYVVEGNKRVSVLKSLGLETIQARVVRLLPQWSEASDISVYYEFVQAYQRCKLYEIYFTQPGSFDMLQQAMGFQSDHVWSEEERRSYIAKLHFFRTVYEKAGGAAFSMTPADALLVWLRKYSFKTLCGISRKELQKSLRGIWLQLQMMDLRCRIENGTAPLRELKKWSGIHAAEFNCG